MTTRVLVVSERTDRTGAPIQLATVLDGIAEYLDAEFTILAGSDVGSRSAFARLGMPVVTELKLGRGLRRLSVRVPMSLRPMLRHARSMLSRVRIAWPDVVYVNSLLSTGLAEPFASVPTIVHVHELGTFADASGVAGRALVCRADAVIVPSEPVCTWVKNAGADPARIHVIPGSVPASAFEAPEPGMVDALRSRLGIADEDFVVSSIGWFGAMKGSDRFLDVAELIRDRSSDSHPVRFLWVGGDDTTGAGQEFARTVRTRALDKVVTTLRVLPDLRALYALSDVVMIASREESMSLVALEAAAQGRTVVAFPGAGGPDELVREGVVTSSADATVGAMANLVEETLRSPRDAAASDAIVARVRDLHRADRVQTATATVIRSVIDASPGHARRNRVHPMDLLRPGSELRTHLRHRYPRAHDVAVWPLRYAHHRKWRRIRRETWAADRAVLETEILPALAADPAAAPVLFVGVGWYTADYPALFPAAAFVTVDIDPSVARFGAADHRVLDLREVPAQFDAGTFGSVVCNGVFGHGLDEMDAVVSAFRAMHTVMRPGATLVVGWNDTEPFRPPALEALAAQAGFVPATGAGLQAWRTPIDSPTRHVYDVYRASDAAASATTNSAS